MQLNEVIIDYELLSQFPTDELMHSKCLPFKQDEFYTHVFIENPNVMAKSLQNRMCKTLMATQKEIHFFLSHKEIGLKLFTLSARALDNQQNQYSISDFLDTLFEFAYSKRCSDIHFECEENSFMIRFRIDGSLKLFFRFEKSLYPMISSIIKLWCDLDITQRRKPLNGRFTNCIDDTKVDIRVSTIPTIYGESIVLRLLDEQFDFHTIDSLGLNDIHRKQLHRGLEHRHGLILITGPTGSGKTTTLYSILHQLNKEEKKIITLEDPIEYQINHVQQVAVNESMNMSFNELLKNVLRQDPDVIMIGEIRDEQSLQIACQASLTGHLVLSTLHTNDALSTINRLYDLKAKPYIIASALKMIVSQRLVLKKCDCENGCEKCNFTLYKGRTSISEILLIDENMAGMITNMNELSDVLIYAKENGFISIYEDALEKLALGITTKEELYKVIGIVDETV